VARTLRYLALLFFLLVVLIPVYVLLVTSFKGIGDASPARAWSLPQTWTMVNWRNAWTALAPAILRTLVMVIPAALISSLLGSMNGFVLSRWRFPGADLVFTLILFGMFIPYQAVMIPLLQLVLGSGIPNGIPSLIVLHVIYGIPITTLIFRNYYAGIGTEVLEAGRIDGAGLFGLYRWIIFPLSAPSFAVVIIWQFTQAWNEFLFAVILTNQVHWPVTVALNNLAGSQLVQWNVLMAACLLAALPTLLVYIFLGRYFIRGLMAGALKG
jgi:glucose/mannose transport system permease protein